MEYYDILHNLRIQAGYTLKEVAAKIGCSESTAQKYENGVHRRGLPYNVIMKFAQLYNVKPEFIIGSEFRAEELYSKEILKGNQNALFVIEYSKLTAQNKTIIDNIIHTLIESQVQSKQ